MTILQQMTAYQKKKTKFFRGKQQKYNKMQKAYKTQNNPEKEGREKGREDIHFSWYQDLLTVHSSQDTVVSE